MRVFRVSELEALLGSAKDGVFSFESFAKDDEEEKFQRTKLQELHRLKMFDHLIPTSFSGLAGPIPLASTETFTLLRILSRRDLSLAVSFGVCGIGSTSVYMFGSETQKKVVSEALLAGKFVGFALTERESGSDIMRTACFVESKDQELLMSGEKWLINFGREGSLFTVFSRDGKGNDCESSIGDFSLYLVNIEDKSDKFVTRLKKEPLLGVKSMDISGFTLQKLPMKTGDVIGAPGNGLSLVLQSLQVTRMACCSFSLGALDTCLRISVELSIDRKLFGCSVWDIHSTKGVIAHAYCDLMISEVLSYSCLSLIHSVSSISPLCSAIAKLETPSRCLRGILDLSPAIGARFFLRDYAKFGTFQRMLRDAMVVPLFDGCSAANMDLIGSCLLRILMSKSSSQHEETLRDPFKISRIRSLEGNPLICPFVGSESFGVIREIVQPSCKGFESINEFLQIKVERLKNRLQDTKPSQRSYELFQCCEEFCKIFACACITRFWAENTSNCPSLAFLESCIRHLFPESPFAFDFDAVTTHILSKTEANMLYSLVFSIQLSN